MSKNLLICELLELYGRLLTEKQSNLLELYYFEDLSLSEIAENEGGSRQGAMDVIKRAEKELLKIEDALGLYERNKEQAKLIELLKESLKESDISKAQKYTKKLEETID